MRFRRIGLAVTVLAAAWLLAPVTPTQASHLPSSTPIACNVTAFVVFTPSNPVATGQPPGNGVFGSANAGGSPVPSSVVCSGAINGLASATGSFDFCENGTADGHPLTHAPGDHGACGPSKGAIEALYDPDIPATAHVNGSGTFTGVGWRWANGSPGPVSCGVDFNGHGTVPVELTITMDCGGGHTFTFPSPGGAIALGLLFDAAADIVHRSDFATTPDFQHCEVNDGGHAHADAEGDPTSDTWNQDNAGQRPFCLRAVVINGTIAGTLD